MASQTPTLLLLTGPTGVGKTQLSFDLARYFDAPIISADSRQIYREMPIGTAAPSLKEQEGIPHYMIGTLSIKTPYNAALYEKEVLMLLLSLFKKHNVVLMVGGSMLYITAILRGIDQMPDVDSQIREQLNEQYAIEGLSSMLQELQQVDPSYYQIVDKQNPKRVIHGLEVFRTTGKPLSSFRTEKAKPRDFRIVPIALVRPRQELYQRINQRTLEMIEKGWIQEAQALYPYRALNALNTIGYKELFDYFDGKCSLEEAIHRIQKNTRIYARKQLTWLKKQDDFLVIDADTSLEQIIPLLPL